MAISKTEYLKGLDKAKRYTDSKIADIDQIELDSTLSQSGQAADAKATGDAIRGLESIIDETPLEVYEDESGNIVVDGNVIESGAINDGGVSTLETWSSKKISDELSYVKEDLSALEKEGVSITSIQNAVNNYLSLNPVSGVDPSKFTVTKSGNTYTLKYNNVVCGTWTDEVGNGEITEEEIAGFIYILGLSEESTDYTPFVKVDSFEQMNDINKQYVLNGEIYASVPRLEETQEVAPFTDWASGSQDESGNAIGIENGKEINSSGTIASATNTFVTGFIPVSLNDTIRIYTPNGLGGAKIRRVGLYRDTHAFWEYASESQLKSNSYGKLPVNGYDSEGNACNFNVYTSTAKYIRISFYYTGTKPDVYITKNEEISLSISSKIEREWKKVGVFGSDAIQRLKARVEYLEASKDEFVTLEMFGAKGDGQTDDTEALRNALLQTKPIHLKDKHYRINGNVEIINTNTVIVGKTGAYSSTSPRLDFHDGGLIITKALQNIRLKGFAIFSNTVGLAMVGSNRMGNFEFSDLYIRANTPVFIDTETGYVWFRSCKFAFNSETTYANPLTVINYTGTGSNRANYIWFDMCAWEGSEIPNHGSDLNYGLIYLNNCSNININKCDICNCASAIKFGDKASQYITLTGNHFWGIKQIANISSCLEFVMTGNSHYTASGSEPLIFPSSRRGHVIVGNYFSGWASVTNVNSYSVFMGNYIGGSPTDAVITALHIGEVTH